jgi:hypothetical protein
MAWLQHRLEHISTGLVLDTLFFYLLGLESRHYRSIDTPFLKVNESCAGIKSRLFILKINVIFYLYNVCVVKQFRTHRKQEKRE